jgi:hypothetical protein
VFPSPSRAALSFFQIGKTQQMAKQQDNPKTPKAPAVATAPVADNPVKVEMAPLEVSIEDRLKALEKKVEAAPNAKRVTSPAVISDPVPVHTCNDRYREVMKEVRAERRSAFEVAKKALETVFVGRNGKDARRVQKDLAPHVAELGRERFKNP